MTAVASWILFALAVERVTEIILTGSIFEAPRDWLSRRSNFLASLLGCGFCLSVWVSALVAWGLPGTLIACPFLDFAIKAFALMGLSNIFHEFIQRAFDKVPWILSLQRVDNEPVQYDPYGQDLAGYPPSDQGLHAGLRDDESADAGGGSGEGPDEDGGGSAD